MSKQFDKTKAAKLYGKETTIVAAARAYCKKIKIPYEERYRHQLSRYLLSLGEDAPERLHGSLDSNGNPMTFEQYCESHNIDIRTVASYSSINHLRFPAFNIKFKPLPPPEDRIDAEFFAEVVKDLAKVGKYKITPIKNNKTFDRLIISDLHVGMSTSGNSITTPVYDDPWNAEVLEKRRKEICDYTLKKRQSDTLYIDDLGDAADGLGGHTSRGGHKLPQNMNDREIFRNLLQFRMNVLDQLAPHYKKIVCNLVLDSNHGPLLDQMVAEAFKPFAELKYKNVEVVMHDAFISHYTVGKNTFVICHGKDNSEQKFGFPAVINDKAAHKIEEYCEYHDLFNGNYVEFCKGDSHQAIFDYSSSNKFSYISVPSAAPPSNWVKMNFKKSMSGFLVQTVQVDGKDRIQSLYTFK